MNIRNIDTLRRALILVLACMTAVVAIFVPANSAGADKAELAQATAVEGLLPVDCLLPGTVRKLGKVVTYLSARRPLKTTGLDCELRGGEYVSYDRADYSTALAIWRPLAEEGNPQAQNYVGEIYERGLGIVPDYAMAAAWYQKAAEKGFAAAQVNLGQLYERGQGVTQGMDTAIEWYRKAAGLNTKQLKFVSYDYSDEQFAAMQGQIGELTRQLDQSHAKQSVLQQDLVSIEARQKADKFKLVALRDQLRLAQREVVHDNTVEQLRSTIDMHEQALANRTLELSEKNSLLTALSVEVHALRNDLSTEIAGTVANAEPALDQSPIIEILEPQLASDDSGLYFAKTRAGLARTIIGRVSSQQEVTEVLVNNKAVRVDSDGVFQHRVRLSDGDTRVQIVAVDNLGARADLAFVLGIETLAEQKQQLAATSPDFSDPLLPIPKLKYGSYHALLIGNQEYQQLPNLDTTIADIDVVAQVLTEKYGFKTTKLVNAKRYDILSALEKLRQELGEKDNLLIYYAGHGELDQVNNRGHWLPVDAEEDSRANWISNVALSDILNSMNAHKVLVIADSCYSGAMTRSPVARFESPRADQDWTPWLQQQVRGQSRLLLSSGGVAPVQDGGGGKHSVFARALLNVLNDNSTVLEGRIAHAKVAQAVVKASEENQFEQTPLYAPLKYTGHEGGDFLFVPRS